MGFDKDSTDFGDQATLPQHQVIVDPNTPSQQVVVDATGALKVTGGGGGEEHLDGDAATGTKGAISMGSDGSNVYHLLVNSSGRLQVDVISGGTSGQQVTDGQAVNPADFGNVTVGTDGTNYQFLKVDSNGELQVDVLTLPNVTLASQVSPFTDDIKITLDGEQVDISDRAARDLGKVDIAGFDVALPVGDNIVGRVKITDGTTIASVCSHLDALLVATPSLESIHEGDHYYVKGWQDVSGAGTTLEFLFSVADSTEWPHALWSISSEAEFTFEMFEGVTTSSDGTPVPIFNNNRNSANTPNTGAFASPTITGAGTLVYSGKIGSGRRLGGDSPDVSLFLGKQNTKYLFRLTHIPLGTHWLDYHFYWYERTN